MNIVLRLADEKDAFRCNSFHNAAYGLNRTEAQWLWTFKNELQKEGDISFVFLEENSKIVGTQALIPVPMIDKKGVYWTAKSEETLIDPQYRGQKLFDKMYKKIFEIAKEKNHLAIWGFTQARRAFVEVGFDIPKSTSQLFMPRGLRGIRFLYPGDFNADEASNAILRRTILNLIGFCATFYSSIRLNIFNVLRRRNRRLELLDLQEAPKESGDLCRDFVAQWGGTTIFRNQTYLNWRIFNNPYIRPHMVGAYYRDELVGFCVFSCDENGMGHIIDIIVHTNSYKNLSAKQVVTSLLCEATKRMIDMGCLGIRAWSMTEHSFDRLVRASLKNLGFLFFNRGTSVVLNTNHSTDKFRGVESFSNWYVTRIYTEGRSG